MFLLFISILTFNYAAYKKIKFRCTEVLVYGHLQLPFRLPLM